VPQETTFSARLIDDLTTIVSRAAAAILDARAGALAPRIKADQSPVTAADEASETLILAEVGRLMPGVPIISEEAVLRARPGPIRGDYILVDPLDGTRELLAGRDEFSINVGLVSGGQPVLGLVAAPALGLIWRTAADGGAERLQLAPGAPVAAARERIAICTRPMPESGIVATVSRSHLDAATEAFLGRFMGAARLVSGSAIKLCHVASGTADVYPRLAPTHQWDVAAGHAVLQAAGGVVTTPERQPLSYDAGQGDFLVRGFIAWGDPAAASKA
jgi:3'(2'), 5'-bisphosphate nucleotidase